MKRNRHNPDEMKFILTHFILFLVLSDSEGWLDVLGSGRLRKRTVVEGDTSHGHKPRNGQTVKIHKKGEMI